ncbi:MAG: hypothetical protein II362_01605 [Alistipes sp.]|nr:hypothetical protein [Alistipes sp.]MBQ5638962.1 hypothetical protein [Alistipes sp.]
MTGMRKRVTIGFLSIVCLLFFSGMVSFVELSRLGRDTGDILKASRRNIELAKEMLDAAHNQNVALIHLTVLGDRSYEEVCRREMAHLEDVMLVAQNEALDKSFLDSLAFATTEMKILVDGYLARVDAAEAIAAVVAADTTLVAADSLTVNEHVAELGKEWYTNEYEAVYHRLTAAVKAYMTSTQSSLAPRTEQMKKNAYRAVTPVLISLVVMIAILLMFYYFMTIYCVNPIVKINKSLGDFLSFRLPFNVKAECKDEVLELKERIDSLTTQLRQQQKH